ncbi:MAG: response regulator transcription factor [Defluviitaleaceae bacterium]|nr:response regulator transcription factor [Defluviitaleaceae bacterium]
MAHIWIVEDDEDIRGIVLYALQSAGFEASGFECGDDFFAELERATPDLLILDIMLPVGRADAGSCDPATGLTVLKKLRQMPNYQTLPVIMLTAKNSEHDKVKGLDSGADDYLTKPFGVMELISRIKALLRRSNHAPADREILAFQNIHMNASHRAVTVDGAVVSLTFKEYELLHYLMINANIVLNRDKILLAVWGYDYEGESRTLDMHIKRLRQKLGEAGAHIKTIRNVGYKMGV